MRILIGLLALALVLVGAYVLFQSMKRKRAVRRLAADGGFLGRLITVPVLESTPPHQAHFLSAGTNEEFLAAIYALSASDKAATRTLRVVFGLLLFLGLVASFLLGGGWLIACAALVPLAGIVPLSGPGARNAAEHVLTTALVLDRWRSHDHAACAKFLEQATALRPLFDAVEYARKPDAPTGA